MSARKLYFADVIMSSGCSHALDMAIEALASPGQNVLLPSPMFSLYETLCGNKAVETKLYKLDPSKSWEIDLEDLEKQIDEKTAAVLLNNPSNPCGSVWSREHVEAIAKVVFMKRCDGPTVWQA